MVKKRLFLVPFSVIEVLIFVLLIISAFRLPSLELPYRTNSSHSRAERHDALVYSYFRLSRPFRVLGVADAPRYLALLAGLDPELNANLQDPDVPTANGRSRGQRLKTEGESRISLLRDTVELIRQHPFGAWPDSFAHLSLTDCEDGVKCDYPHNIFLEFIFYFGWFAGVLLLIYLPVSVILICKLFTNNAMTVFGCLAVMHLLLLAQLSANMVDNSRLVCVLFLFIVLEQSTERELVS
jgi:hypothetical protein